MDHASRCVPYALPSFDLCSLDLLVSLNTTTLCAGCWKEVSGSEERVQMNEGTASEAQSMMHWNRFHDHGHSTLDLPLISE